MPKEDVRPEAILEALKKVDIVSELLDEKNKNNLKMIAEGKVSGGKQIGPYARLLAYSPGEVIMREGEWGGNTFYLSVKGELHVLVADDAGQQRKVGRIEAGSCFGEMSVLAGVPRNATIVAPADGAAVTILEMVRPALRLLRSLKKFAEKVDSTYRIHGLGNTIAQIQEAAGDSLSAIELVALGNLAQFMAYGKHHLLIEEGKPIDRLFLIRSGWVRRVRGVPIFADITEGAGAGTSTLIPEDFLGAGNCLGLEGLTGQSTWQYSAELMARTEVLEIPLAELRSDQQLCDRVLKVFADFSVADDDTSLRARADKESLTAAKKEIATGIVDGVNLLVMDMDLCIRCGNCSLACHKVHGQSRLLRRGIHIERPVQPESKATQHVLSPSVCMHCKDPECLTGCPTGAIFRDPRGHVDIDPKTCIGCFDCATQCPYNAITMVPRNGPPTASPNLVNRIKGLFSFNVPAATAAAAEGEDMVAIKCNLCEATPLNPSGASRPAYSCEENCPTGALVRVNPQEYFGEIEKTLGLVFRDQTHAIGRNIHKSDPIARFWHIGGVLFTIAVTAMIAFAVVHHGFNDHLGGTWLTMRWVTGLVGLVGIAGVMTYPIRKPVYRRRAGALRYWLLAHIYLGVIAGIVLLMHGASHGGGLLTATLMVSFDLVILSGLFGLACYLVVPRIMTSIEGDPLLIEDLETRRNELREELAAIADKGDDQMRQLLEGSVRRHFFSIAYLVRQYIRREELTTLLARARLQFKSELSALDDKEKRNLLLKAIERTATLRRVESLVYLHRLLKVWLAPHVVSSSLMLALMCVHVIQVVFFNVR
ncbi:MAG TPA: cyclic nucleotide-binding domain-containing protein [Pyrinomonadaceae bacterium]|nr:cyclic nucleotide-binding domain-containing protein [Pyrinomonadaceae bacterium]